MNSVKRQPRGEKVEPLATRRLEGRRVLVSGDLQARLHVPQHLAFCFFTLRQETLYVECLSQRRSLMRVPIATSRNKLAVPTHAKAVESGGGTQRCTPLPPGPLTLSPPRSLTGTICAGAQEGEAVRPEVESGTL